MDAAICIDFGSAYTKVALRHDLRSRGQLLLDLPSAQQDRSLGMGFCIPTVVTERRRRGSRDFAYGDAAASIVPADAVEVYRNWKPKLLDAPDDKTSLGSTWREVATEFFARLRHDVLAKLPSDMRESDQWAARVCIPRVEGHDELRAREVMVDVLRSSGWIQGDSVDSPPSVVYEPVANTWGIITEGVNHPGIAGARYHFQAMVKGSRVQRSLRAAITRCMVDFRFPILVIDVGAYTTDCALLFIDWSFVDNDRIEVIHRSYPMGVKELDAAIFSHASSVEQAAIASQDTHTWEAVKPRLYGGVPVALSWEDDGQMRSTHISPERVHGLIEAFAEDVVACVEKFSAQHMKNTVAQEAILTGGGMRLPQVASAITRAVTARRIPARDAIRPRSGDMLVRGATAIGGVSLLIG